MSSYWFGDVSEVGCTPCPTLEPGKLARRLDRIRADLEHYTPLSWEMARDCGVVQTREEYLRRLRELCIFLAEQGISLESQSAGQELIQMVRMLDQVDEAANLLTERSLEWFLILNPSFSWKYRKVRGKKAKELIRKAEAPLLQQTADEVERLSALRTAIAEEISARAGETLPNCTALTGGVVAARLLSEAGGLPELAALPAGAIQVLGARAALFSHLRTGSPPPKHGILYQNPLVHRAQKGRRGRISRVLAAKLAIAARIDCFRGEADQEFIRAARETIDHAAGGAG